MEQKISFFSCFGLHVCPPPLPEHATSCLAVFVRMYDVRVFIIYLCLVFKVPHVRMRTKCDHILIGVVCFFFSCGNGFRFDFDIVVTFFL